MLTDWQLAAHANALIVAGSETSTTTLSGLFYYLMKNKSSYMRLKQEIRSAFKSLDDIDSKKVEQLPYMTACLEETFRIYPPIPIAMPRLTPPGGCEIAGRWVPGRVSLSSALIC
jgi:cytochrome P450